MKKLSLLFPVMACLVFSSVSAATVSVTNAQTVAINFFKIAYPAQVGRGNINPVLKYTQTEPDGSVDFYVFDINPQKGFVIVSAHDEVIPVVGYSNESYFNTDFQQVGLSDWVNKTSRQIHQTVLTNLQADSRISNLWQAYSQGVNPGSEKSTSVGPLLSTTWNQLPYYNADCPLNTGDGQRCVTGCVATAMAQIMKYWNYPAQGTGSFSYVDNTNYGYQLNIGTLSANFGTTTYQWTQMPNYLTGNNAAVALLMSHCGISVAMDYSDGGSGAIVLQAQAGGANAPCAQHSYVTYFSYNPNTIQGVFQSNYSATQWNNLIEAEMNAGRVVQYQGADPRAGGHTWVCDGYDANNKLHMNWGWGGADNGYYAANNLSVGGYDFYTDDAALIGIEPPTYAPPGEGTCLSYHLNSNQSICTNVNTVYPDAAGTVNDFYSQQWTWSSVPGEVRSLMKLNLSSIPANAYITSAKISFSADDTSALGYAGEPTYGTANASYLQQVTAPWNSSVTWNTQPATTTTNQVTLAQSVNYTENYNNVDITAFVNSWIQTPATNYGMMIKTVGSNYYNSMIFCSSTNADTTKRPLLDICYYACNASAAFTYQSLGGSVLQFTSNSTSNMALTYSWVFRNQVGVFATSNVANPVVTFSGQPPYSATLLVRDSLNTACFDSINHPVDFNPNTVCVTLQNGKTHATGAALLSNFTTNFNYATGYGEFFSAQWTNGGAATESRGLLKYDLSQIPAGSVIVSANLNLYADTINFNGYAGQPTYGSNASYLRQVTSTWDPATVTWATQPSASTVGQVLLAQSTSVKQNYLNVDVSGFVQNWISNPIANYGMMLQMIAQNYYNCMIFCSSGHADTTRWPSLDICFIPPVHCQAHASFIQQNMGAGQVRFTNTSTDNLPYTFSWTFYNASGPFSTSSVANPQITFTGQPPYSASLVITDSVCSDSMSQVVNVNNCLTLQNGSAKCTGATIFSLPYELSSNYNFASGYSEFLATQWNYNSGPAEGRSLLAYDLSQIPPGSTITSANLSLYADTINFNGTPGQPTYGSANSCYLHQVTSPWNPATVTWNTQPSSSTVNEVLVPQSNSTAENYLNIDISSLAQIWVNNPGSNYGLLIQIITQNYSNSMVFCSSAHADTTRWPRLDICYQLPSPCHLVASFTQQDLVNSNVQFTNTSTINSGTLLNWYFYNGSGLLSTSTSQNPLITFSGPTPYSATLKLTDTLNGCLDSLSEPVIITACTGTDSFTYVGIGNGRIQFTNLSTSSNGSVCSWTFLNANGVIGTSTQVNPLFAYTGSQPYYALLVISDSVSRSCIDSFEMPITFTTAISLPVDDAGGLAIFPNPNNGNSFSLLLPSGFDFTTTQVKVFDVMGREVNIEHIERLSNGLRLSMGENCAAGIYTVVVSSNSKQQCCKLVIVR